MAGVPVVVSVGERQLAFSLEPNGPGITLGRGSEAEVSIADGSVSRKHCRVTIGASGQIEVRDLASANGTFVNGQRVESAALKPADQLVVGKVAVLVRVDAAATPRPPAADRSTSSRAKAPPLGDDLRCERCKRLVTLSTVKDGQLVEWGEKIVCPACKDVASLADLEGNELLIAQLAEEGLQVVARLSPAMSLSPVFKAKRAALNDLVAVKALPLVRGMQPRKIERFQTEARTMAQIQHPNVVRVYDVRARRDFIYLVMEFVEGESLLRRLDRETKLPQPVALTIGLGLAKALEAVAKQGVVHRDLKPANVIIARDGTPKLADFGCSKDLLSSANATGDHETIGTIRYMPPEQALDAKSVDYRSDVYSLAATLFHLITGKLPHPNLSDRDLLRAVVTRNVPPFDPKVAPELPEPIARVLGKALRPDPNERHRSAVAFREDLQQAIAAVAGPAPPNADMNATVRTVRPQLAAGVMSGGFESEQLVELVQMIGLNSKTGFLLVTAEKGHDGQLAFKDGRIVAARTRTGLKGADAALAILLCARGQFEFRPGVPANFKVEHQLPVEGLLLEVMRRRDESGR